jgi:hypothetical protein
MTRRDRTMLLGLAVLALVMGALPALGVHTDVLLAAPVLALLIPLLAGRYLGEERLARMAEAFAPRRRRAAGTLVPRRLRGPRATPRGGSLIARALAVRPPPAALPT